MTDEETIVLLTWAALLDPRLKRVDDEEATDRALAWHMLLVDVDVNDAREAIAAHYRESREAVMPADILARCGVVEGPDIPDITADIVAASKARILAEHGVSDGEYEANKRDAAWIAATFPKAINS